MTRLHNLPLAYHLFKIFIPFFTFLCFSFAWQDVLAAQVTLTWFANQEADIAGYKVYCGLTSRDYTISKDAGNNTSYSFTNLDDGTAYYFAVTAYDTYGNESDYSDEVTFTTSASSHNTPPASNTGQNQAPTASNDGPITTNENTSVSIQVLSNDFDVDGDTLIITSADQGINGSTFIVGNSVVYTPTQGYNGTDQFFYMISDGQGGSDSARVTVEVEGTVGGTPKGIPINHAPVAIGSHLGTAEDTPLNGTLQASDPDGDGLRFALVGNAVKGVVVLTDNNGSFRYEPYADVNGADFFTFKVNDGQTDSNYATMTISISPVNDVPQARPDRVSTDEDKPVTVDVLANDIDIDGDVLTIGTFSQGGYGSVGLSGGKLVYTPANHHGVDNFSYNVLDGHGGTATATVTVQVADVNHAPQAVDDNAVTAEDTPVTIDVLANDIDQDGDVLIIGTAGRGSHGSVSLNDGKPVYSPFKGYHGSDSFSYEVVDSHGGSALGLVTVTIRSENHVPVAAPDTLTADGGATVTVDVLANDSDIDGDTLSLTNVSPGGGGATRISGDVIVYTPAQDFQDASDSFTYTVTDDHGATATGVVTLTLNYAAPITDFRASPVTGPCPLRVDFSDLSSGKVSSWSWDFGDQSGPDAHQNPTHTFSSPGKYTITMTAKGPGGADTEQKSDYIIVSDPLPKAEFSATPTSGQDPLSVQFNNLSEGNGSYTWNFGDGGFSHEANPVHLYTDPGVYTVRLTLSGSGGMDEMIKTNLIEVSSPALPPVPDDPWPPDGARDVDPSVAGGWSTTGADGTVRYDVYQILGQGKPVSVATDITSEIVMLDNSDPECERQGDWLEVGANDACNNSYLYHDAGDGAASVTWRPDLPEDGRYAVYVRWPVQRNGATNAKYTVAHSLGKDTIEVDQTKDGGSWFLLGEFLFNKGKNCAVTLSGEADGLVAADAIRIAGNIYKPQSLLLSDTVYHWRVVAFNESGESVEGPIWSFKTAHLVDLKARVGGKEYTEPPEVQQGTPVTVNLNLFPASLIGKPVEMWLSVINKSDGLKWWYGPSGWENHPVPFYSGTIDDEDALRYELVNGNKELTAGTWVFAAVVDDEINGRVDEIYEDTLTLIVGQ